MRVVLDANILISSLFWKGVPRRIVDRAVEGRFQSLTAPGILAEYERVLVDKFEVPPDRLAMALREVLSYSELIVDEQDVAVEVRDPKDRMVLSCAAAGGATHIVTGDDDLLVLGSLGPIRILKAREFLNTLGG